ncbi:thiol peroxidase [Elizabethkingia sp. JS20170427COW]|uniref:thiol peroxidase n=1 Tax=Elizabethkingia sp. JS20170427COW TaxID=2583851 RepID=UPI0011106D4A|nr:thiol peroxidase [Elizabethkingia sp. JS20170427COW]QCX53621.1 thiol peroxidase [Elizabethkingia sp. JS20170427COW]
MANITFHGDAASTVGTLPQAGEQLKDFALVASDLSEKNLESYKGKKVVFNIFPSVDTGVCAASVRHFNQDATSIKNAVVVNVSKDLPFALNRFCAAEGIKNVESLSDFRGSFGNDYGVTLADSPLKGLLSRAVIVADENGKVLYSEQVPEITQEPNYEAALNALK